MSISLTYETKVSHSMMSQLNRSLLHDSMMNLMKGSKRRREKGETFLTFDEGMADHTAIGACRISKDTGLEEKADERRLVSMDPWKSGWK